METNSKAEEETMNIGRIIERRTIVRQPAPAHVPLALPDPRTPSPGGPIPWPAVWPAPAPERVPAMLPVRVRGGRQ